MPQPVHRRGQRAALGKQRPQVASTAMFQSVFVDSCGKKADNRWPLQITTVSWYSPKTRRIASDISPTVAKASTAARIHGIKLAPDRALSSTPLSAACQGP